MCKNRIFTGPGFASVFALALMSGAMATPVLAGGEGGGVYPRFEGELSVELESDHTFRSDTPDSKITDTYPTIELGGGLLFSPNFSVQGTFVLEPVEVPPGAAPGDDLFFDDVGGYVEELYAQFLFGPVRLFAGKFDAAFGQAWDLTPGIYGTDFAEEYELVERVGAGFGVSVQATVVGDLDLTASLFTMDTSQLSRSIFAKRDQVKTSDGGAGNSGELDSFSITLDGRNIPMLSGIAWHLGYSHQEKGKTADDLSDETGLVAGLYGSHKLSDTISLEWVGEIAQLQNVGGGPDDVTYYTLGGVLTFSERYNLAIAHTTRSFDIAAGADIDDTNTQFSVGMEIHDGWSLDVGYKITEENNVESETVGVLLAKTFAFNTGE